MGSSADPGHVLLLRPFDLGRAMRSHRVENGLTQKQLAAALPAALKEAAEALPAIPLDWGAVEEHIAEIDIRADDCERVAAETLESVSGHQT